jgi:hypothetical protein
MSRRPLQLAAVFCLALCHLQAQAPTPGKADPWAGLRFLLGYWQAKVTGGVAQGPAADHYNFRFELHDHVLARHARLGPCTNPDDYECAHTDLLYIYPTADGKSFQAIYFDNSGHVVRYDVTTPKANTTVLLSDSTQPGPQYRLSYTLSDGTLNGLLEIKLPNQTDFTSLLEWSGKQE